MFHRECVTLGEAGFDVHLLLPNPQDERREGVCIHGLPPVAGRYRRVMLWPRLFRVACALEADLYHFHGPELIPVAYLLKRVTGACIVYDMHEDFRAGRGLEGRGLRTLERWCFRWVDHVVVSDAAYTDVVGPSRASATLVANYVQPPTPPVEYERAIPPPFRLVCTGTLSEERGLLDLLDLAQAFRQEGCDWRLDMAGVCYRETDRRRAERRFRRRRLDDVVERTAWDRHVPWRVLMRRTAQAHIGLALLRPHPNAEQVIPTKFYEYLHYGLPILCSDFPLWRRFVEEHHCGRAVPPGDTQAALAVLKRWAADPARYRRLSENARAAASQYQWPKMGRRLVRLYNRLLGTQRPLPPAPEEASASL